MDTTKKLKKFYKLLLNHYGKQNWWPAPTKLECILGTILTQNTSWKNVEKGLKNLRSHMEINYKNLKNISVKELAILIKPSGYYNQKAKRIKRFIEFIEKNYNGDLNLMFEENVQELRTKLLSINGIGPETADTIILYACNKPMFVVDTYTYRILSRHKLIPVETNYNEIQSIFMDHLENSPQLFNEYHALLVKVGKQHCKKQAICNGCPLEDDPHEV